MGTNYYWHDSPCDECGRYETIHVGKSGFIWRAYPHRLFNPEHPEWGYDPESPFGFPVESFVDWCRVLLTRPGELWNEYGHRIDDVWVWLTDKAPYSGPLSNIVDDDYLDRNGYLFSRREFS